MQVYSEATIVIIHYCCCCIYWNDFYNVYKAGRMYSNSASHDRIVFKVHWL